MLWYHLLVTLILRNTLLCAGEIELNLPITLTNPKHF